MVQMLLELAPDQAEDEPADKTLNPCPQRLPIGQCLGGVWVLFGTTTGGGWFRVIGSLTSGFLVFFFLPVRLSTISKTPRGTGMLP